MRAILNSARDRRAYDIDEFCAAYKVGRTLVYEEIASGRLKTFVVGKRGRRITVEAAIAWVRAREAAAA